MEKKILRITILQITIAYDLPFLSLCFLFFLLLSLLFLLSDQKLFGTRGLSVFNIEDSLKADVCYINGNNHS